MDDCSSCLLYTPSATICIVFHVQFSGLRVYLMSLSVFIVFLDLSWALILASFTVSLRLFTGHVMVFLFDEITWITDLTSSSAVFELFVHCGLSTDKQNVQTLPLLVLDSALCSNLSRCDGNSLMVLDNVATAQW